jgi:hypothetical protein
MPRHADLEFIEDLVGEFDLNPGQRISTLMQRLEEDADEDEEEDEE